MLGKHIAQGRLHIEAEALHRSGARAHRQNRLALERVLLRLSLDGGRILAEIADIVRVLSRPPLGALDLGRGLGGRNRLPDCRQSILRAYCVHGCCLPNANDLRVRGLLSICPIGKDAEAL
jgi:hypothetical protein